MANITCNDLATLLGLPVLLIERGILDREPYAYGTRVTIQAQPSQITPDHWAVLREAFAPDDVFVVTA